jgi:hypothetical protein
MSQNNGRNQAKQIEVVRSDNEPGFSVVRWRIALKMHEIKVASHQAFSVACDIAGWGTYLQGATICARPKLARILPIPVPVERAQAFNRGRMLKAS